MNFELLSALALFAFVSSITPGPNNLMLMNSGANFGFRLTLPHLLGVVSGFMFMLFTVGLGVFELFNAFEQSYLVLKVISVSYLLYLAYKIATTHSHASHHNPTQRDPMSFIQAALFQWVNPKAWTMALGAITLYAPTGSIWAVTFVMLTFGLINLPCTLSWVLVGQKMQRVLTNEKRLRLFNLCMAFLLIASLYPVLFEQIT